MSYKKHCLPAKGIPRNRGLQFAQGAASIEVPLPLYGEGDQMET
jgi:hypothetical protein